MAERPLHQRGNSFVLLGEDLRERLISPIPHFSFWVFVLLGVIVFGGVPVWVELLRFTIGGRSAVRLDSLITAVDAYFPAVGCAAAVQLAFSEDTKKYVVSFGYLVTVFFAVACILMILLEQTFTAGTAWLSRMVLCLLAILMWWIANGLDPTFQDTLDVEAPLGGSTSSPLDGNTIGFQT
jgi:hypothetical protein